MTVRSGLKKRHLLLLAALLVAGCRFQPVYGTHSAGSSTVADLNNIAIDNIPDRNGQVLRNDLIDRMYGKDRSSQPAYRLQVTITHGEEDLGILANATATRSLLNLSSTYVLTDAKGKQILTGTAHSVASFDKLDQIYATVAARQDAYDRTLHEVSEQIVNRLSLYFAEKQ